jgi:hypothetical protein
MSRQMDQMLVDRSQFFIIHFSDGLPRHLFANFMAGGIDSGAHRRNEILQLPILHEAEAGTDRRQLSLHATFQIGAVAFAAILKRQDIFAVLHGRSVWRSLDGAVKHGLSSGKHASSQHHQPEQIKPIRRIRRRLPGGGLTADVGDKSL